MTDVTVSPKYQVVIPRAVREEAGIRPGMKLKASRFGRGGILLLSPVNIADYAGIIDGPNDFVREKGQRESSPARRRKRRL